MDTSKTYVGPIQAANRFLTSPPPGWERSSAPGYGFQVVAGVLAGRPLVYSTPGYASDARERVLLHAVGSVRVDDSQAWNALLAEAAERAALIARTRRWAVATNADGIRVGMVEVTKKSVEAVVRIVANLESADARIKVVETYDGQEPEEDPAPLVPR